MAVKITNAAYGILSTGITATQTTINLTAGQGLRFPTLTASDWAWGTLTNAANVVEIVKITNVTGDVLTVVRGQDGTTAQAYALGDRIELRLPAALVNDKANQVDLTSLITAFTGVITMWSGSFATIPARWHLCDGTNGTPDLRDRFIVGAGASYGVGATGGVNLNALTVAQMPSHNHGVNDPGHNHGLSDPGHAHGVSDGGHNHGGPGGVSFMVNASGGGNYSGGPAQMTPVAQTAIGYTGIAIQVSGTGVTLSGAYTGISTQYTGTGAAVENRPPYYALAFIMFLG